ncbi:hypothetical protein ACX1C1_23350 [Paenibacillus sp. strain BS8-2]
MISKKHCLFCTELISAERDGEYMRYSGCMCAPQSYYRIKHDAYSAIQASPYEYKRRLLPIISAYIRDLDDKGVRVMLTTEQVEFIMISPEVPMTAEQKEQRLLSYIFGRSDSIGDSVNLYPLNRHYNIAYASNLQELVYLIEKARDAGWLLREGTSLTLTKAGWAEAAAVSGGDRLKDCCVLTGSDEVYSMWLAEVPASLEQCGFRARLLGPEQLRRMEAGITESLATCKLLIVDVTGAGPATYYAAGHAANAGVQILWTIQSAATEQSDELAQWLRLIPWDTTAQWIERVRERVAT